MTRYESRIPFFLIWRFITRSNKWTLSLTIFLMAVAFINLVFITSLFNGIVEGSNDQIINTYVGHVAMTPPENHDTIDNVPTALDTIRNTPGIVGASAQNTVPAEMKYKNKTISREIVAINPSDEKTVTNVATKMVAGAYLSENDTNGIILGRQIAGGADVEPGAFDNVQVGDTMTLMVRGAATDFVIRGIFDTKFMTTDSRAFITTKAYAAINPGSVDQATKIIIRIDKKGNEDKAIVALQANNVAGTFSPWQDSAGLMKSVSSSFLSINVLMTFVGFLIAAVTIFIVIYIDIMNKKRQIGILRAIGIKSWIIRLTYVLQTSVYSFAGVLIGTALFYAAIVPYFIAHPFSLPICDAVLVVNPADFIFRGEAVMLVAIASGLIPAFIVTRMKILNTILGK